MTPLNMARHRNSPHTAFWRMLKQGYDHFEVNGEQEGQHGRSAGFTPQKTANTEPEAKRDSPIFCVNYMHVYSTKNDIQTGERGNSVICGRLCGG
jgi:murein L,D-transpeptidase YafK